MGAGLGGEEALLASAANDCGAKLAIATITIEARIFTASTFDFSNMCGLEEMQLRVCSELLMLAI
jgi:hypothetical protein